MRMLCWLLWHVSIIFLFARFSSGKREGPLNIDNGRCQATVKARQLVVYDVMNIEGWGEGKVERKESCCVGSTLDALRNEII